MKSEKLKVKRLRTIPTTPLFKRVGPLRKKEFDFYIIDNIPVEAPEGGVSHSNSLLQIFRPYGTLKINN